MSESLDTDDELTLNQVAPFEPQRSGSPPSANAVTQKSGSLYGGGAAQATSQTDAQSAAKLFYTSSKELPHVNCMEVEAPSGVKERISVSALSTPQSLEHCLRVIFALGNSCRLVLRDVEGTVMPMDGGLADGSFKLEVIKVEENRSAPKVSVIEAPKKRDSHHKGRPADTRAAALDEAAFWSRVLNNTFVASVANQPSVTCSSPTEPLETKGSAPVERSKFRTGSLLFDEGGEHNDEGRRLFRIADYDTSPQRINNLYDAWSEEDGGLSSEGLRGRLAAEYRIFLDEEQMETVLARIRKYIYSKSGVIDTDSSLIPQKVFFTLWQRLMLATVSLNVGFHTGEVRLIGYNERSFNETTMSEEEFCFGGNLRFKQSRETVSCWARIDNAGPDRLVRMGVKFYLHPIATEEAIEAAKDGMTKVDVYRHQYFASLEVYALFPDGVNSYSSGVKEEHGGSSNSVKKFRTSVAAAPDVPPRVNKCIVRSTMFIVATGDPRKGYRDWLLTIVNSEQATHKDPFDRFLGNSEAAAAKILDSVRADLRAHGRLREFQADFLLYSIIDRCASELIPISKAYGHRLRWLQNKLEKEQLKLAASYVMEVSKVRLELQELRQWVGQLRSIVGHLEVDCKGIVDQQSSAVSWTFGTWAKGSGKSLLLFLRGTRESLDRSADRLEVLEELALNFAKDHERFRDTSMNKTLYVLTIATAIFMPAQFFAGVYGMNFVREDGTPAMPELRAGDSGYVLWWVAIAALIVLGAALAWCFLGQAHTRICRRPRKLARRLKGYADEL
mmetsp:Transcript_37630/g.82591  ORF Transcript_37630/g.82591 Transcript_37630/m.82591 type:complete len:786 (+) Transcript_37630:170-2527(+)|eukprot:CAMPEP_0170596518 /NCGR_PEP_ID=MMETSP0224-20130122/15169_1 /TAXON_ID=285029 /ORGANISM="Togula jolla, Strain CCCM 725" /LENGTH=785 /DNA_ID=CAMNT_0010920833 /DNA_START=159 /DNA_END=2516 /DNA_ORIENTATION=+